MKCSGRFKKLLTAAARLLWADEQPGASIAPDGGPGPHYGPMPWEPPKPPPTRLMAVTTRWRDTDGQRVEHVHLVPLADGSTLEGDLPLPADAIGPVSV